MHHFYYDTHVHLEHACGFLLVTTWLTPFALLLSLSANDSVLPGAGAPQRDGAGRAGKAAAGQTMRQACAAWLGKLTQASSRGRLPVLLLWLRGSLCQCIIRGRVTDRPRYKASCVRLFSACTESPLCGALPATCDLSVLRITFNPQVKRV